jgi:hypothetical protein
LPQWDEVAQVPTTSLTHKSNPMTIDKKYYIHSRGGRIGGDGLPHET